MTVPASFPDPPAPPPPGIRRVDDTGRPTMEWAAYEAKLAAWLKALLEAVKG